jgi:hypothetical protein
MESAGELAAPAGQNLACRLCRLACRIDRGLLAGGLPADEVGLPILSLEPHAPLHQRAVAGGAQRDRRLHAKESVIHE